MELAVKNIVSQLNAGVIFTGENSEGRVFRVRVKEPLFPAIGESYAVTGEFTDYRDGYGRSFAQNFEIFRIYMNYTWKDEKGITPAMRFGLAKGPVKVEDVLYWTPFRTNIVFGQIFAIQR